MKTQRRIKRSRLKRRSRRSRRTRRMKRGGRNSRKKRRVLRKKGGTGFEVMTKKGLTFMKKKGIALKEKGIALKKKGQFFQNNKDNTIQAPTSPESTSSDVDIKVSVPAFG